jgi:acyl-CoA thioester hydrolase
MDIRIYYEDTDCGGVVYYANYLKYFERARTHYLEERGISVAELLKTGTQFVVIRAEIEYRSPGRYGETLTIETILGKEGRTGLKFSHKIRERLTHRLVVEGSATLITTNLDGKPKRLDPALAKTLLGLPKGRHHA